VPGQVVDTESAQEFMREALQQISEAELDAVADELEIKHARFRAFLGQTHLRQARPEELRPVLRSIFATRRRTAELVSGEFSGHLSGWTADLLDGEAAPVERRFQVFCDRLERAGLARSLRYDLASELLHYTAPDTYWLWTRWVWDPETRTGALPLVTMEEYDFGTGDPGPTYLRVGQALAFVHETGRAAGFTRIGEGRFGVDVYLACVYAVYVYTTVRMRMTQEFNRVIPPLAELCRRFLGVYKMEM